MAAARVSVPHKSALQGASLTEALAALLLMQGGDSTRAASGWVSAGEPVASARTVAEEEVGVGVGAATQTVTRVAAAAEEEEQAGVEPPEPRQVAPLAVAASASSFTAVGSGSNSLSSSWGLELLEARGVLGARVSPVVPAELLVLAVEEAPALGGVAALVEAGAPQAAAAAVPEVCPGASSTSAER